MLNCVEVDAVVWLQCANNENCNQYEKQVHMQIAAQYMDDDHVVLGFSKSGCGGVRAKVKLGRKGVNRLYVPNPVRPAPHASPTRSLPHTSTPSHLKPRGEDGIDEILHHGELVPSGKPRREAVDEAAQVLVVLVEVVAMVHNRHEHDEHPVASLNLKFGRCRQHGLVLGARPYVVDVRGRCPVGYIRELGVNGCEEQSGLGLVSRGQLVATVSPC